MESSFSSLAFIEELDRLKNVLRQTLTYDGSRSENTAEHSWHLATAVLVSASLSDEPLNLERTLKMALVHDVVEIDAGDTFLYDKNARNEKFEKEKAAAHRIFGLLPSPLGVELNSLWEDYEKQDCPESRFVMAFDRILPLMANFKTKGHAWKKNGVRKHQVLEKNRKIEKSSKKLWVFAQHLINESVRLGYLAE